METIFYTDPIPTSEKEKINFQGIESSIAVPTPLYSEKICTRKFYSTFTRHQGMAKNLPDM